MPNLARALYPPRCCGLGPRRRQNKSFPGMDRGCISVRLGPNENPQAKRELLMQRFAILLAIFLAILAGVISVPLLGQQAGVGTIVRNDPALDKLVAPGTKIEKLPGDSRFMRDPYG